MIYSPARIGRRCDGDETAAKGSLQPDFILKPDLVNLSHYFCFHFGYYIEAQSLASTRACSGRKLSGTD